MRRIYDWSAIQRYHDAGNGFADCRKRFGFTHGAWNKAIIRGDLLAEHTSFSDRRRKFDWAAIQEYYNEGHSVRACMKRFGFCSSAWMDARRRGNVMSRPQRMPLSDLLQGRRNRRHVKQRLINAGLLTNKCEICGLRDWLGESLSMHLDHINGIRDDHRLENLRMLCPNCHSQTETYGGRNRRRRRLQERRAVA